MTKIFKSELPLISIGIPVFNGENYIRESIDSVLRQTENNFELIVSDNCSTDRTLEIVSSFSDPRIRIVKNDFNMGSTRNCNRCIELARGEYFVLLPHDDILMPTMLETFSKALALDPLIGLVYSSYYVINGRGERIDLRIVAPEDKIMNSEDAIREFILHGSPAQCVMTRKKIFSSIGVFNEEPLTWCDADLWCRVFLDGNKAVYFKTPQNCIRVHPAQGQRAFMKGNERSVEIISNHLGYVPNQAFFRNNTYHSLAFQHVQKLFSRIPRHSGLQKLRPLSVKGVLEQQIADLLTSSIRGKWADVRQDVNLIIKIVKWAGFFRTIPVLLSTPFYIIKRIWMISLSIRRV